MREWIAGKGVDHTRSSLGCDRISGFKGPSIEVLQQALESDGGSSSVAVERHRDAARGSREHLGDREVTTRRQLVIWLRRSIVWTSRKKWSSRE